jgi:hypothetical protein
MRILRRLLLALLLSLLVGFAVGTLLRLRYERPVRYLGSASPTLPLDVVDTPAVVLDARHHEEQIG